MRAIFATMNFAFNREFAQQLDSKDELASFKQEFLIPKHTDGSEVVYLCGNSLGLQPAKALDYLKEELEDWQKFGVEGHFHGRRPWFHYHKFLTQHAAALAGAKEHEVVVMNQLTVNLHLLLASFYQPNATRYKIIMEAGAFPSDMYMVQSQVEWHGFKYEEAVIEIGPRAGEYALRTEDILKAIEEHGSSTALVFFSGVQYYTGQLFDIKRITEKAHSVGALAGFDLAHAAGNVVLELHNWQVDFAAWCSYKYLNSGPGNVSSVFIHEKHGLDPQRKRLAGWWGYQEQNRFLMQKGYVPEPGAAGWQLSNAPVFGMAVHLASLEMFSRAGMQKLQTKGKMLQEYLCFVIDEVMQQNTNFKLDIITPRSPEEHGCQVSIIAKNRGKELFDFFTENGIICDWREPEVIRMAAVPMYNTFADIFRVGSCLFEFISRLSVAGV